MTGVAVLEKGQICGILGENNPLNNPFEEGGNVDAKTMQVKYESWLCDKMKERNKDILGALSRLKALRIRQQLDATTSSCNVEGCTCQIAMKYVEKSLAQLARRKAEKAIGYSMMASFTHRVLDKKGNYHYYDESEESKPKPNFLVERNTGLLDLEGLPFFEGDVIALLEPNEDNERVEGVVTFLSANENRAAGFYIVYSDGRYDCLDGNILATVLYAKAQNEIV